MSNDGTVSSFAPPVILPHEKGWLLLGAPPLFPALEPDRLRDHREPGGVIELGRRLDGEARDLLGRQARAVVGGKHRSESEIGAAADRVELAVFLHGAVRAYSENAVRVREQHVELARLDRVVLFVHGDQVIALLQCRVKGLPGLEDVDRAVEARLRPAAPEVVAHDQLERRGARRREPGVARLDELVVVRDIGGRFLAAAPFGEGISGDRAIAVLPDDRDRGHDGYFRRFSLAAMRMRRAFSRMKPSASAWL